MNLGEAFDSIAINCSLNNIVEIESEPVGVSGFLAYSTDKLFFLFDNYSTPKTMNVAMILNIVFRLEGTTKEGQKIRCDNCFIIASTPYLILQPKDQVVIGEENQKSNEIAVPLINYIKGPTDINIGNYRITIQGEAPSNSVIRTSQITDIPIHQRNMTITSEESIPVKDLVKFTWEVCQLLSLATGNAITFCYYRTKNKTNVDKVFGTKTIGKRFNGSLLPNHIKAGSFLEMVLPSFLNKDELVRKNLFFNVLVNIFSSGDGYLEQRFFNIVQSIEILSSEFSEAPTKKPSSNLLKKELFKTLDTFAKANDWIDLSEINNIKSSIGYATSSKNLTNRVHSLLAYWKIDNAKIGLDIKALKDARDKIAHTGRFDNYKNLETHMVNMDKGLFLIQLIIFKWLGYSGQINGYSPDFRNTKNIAHYFVENAKSDKVV